MEQIYPIAEIYMQDGGVMRIELYPEKAPLTVASFADLATTGYYDGLSFHRVVKDFVIQGGSKNNSCAGGDCGFTVKGEFKDNGVDTGLKHKRGTISMARAGHPDSASTQFFIIHKDSPFLDNQYAAFGLMLEGFEVLDRIADVPVSSQMDGNKPTTPQIIEKIVIIQGQQEIQKPVRIS